jgi:hypothetical protein
MPREPNNWNDVGREVLPLGKLIWCAVPAAVVCWSVIIAWLCVVP